MRLSASKSYTIIFQLIYVIYFTPILIFASLEMEQL